MRIPALLTAALLAVTLTACGSTTSGPGGSQDPSGDAAGTQPSGAPSSPDTVIGTPSDLPTPPPKPGSTPTVPPPVDSDPPPGLRERPAVERALDDAATRAKVTPARVVVAAYSTVTWKDGSLGCPAEGKVYTQMPVDGELLLLRVDDELMAYTAGADGGFSYCATPSGDYTVRTS